MPDGAPTIGNGAYFSALYACWPPGDELLDLAPGGDVGREQREAEIGADREMLALVVDHERLDLLPHERDRLPEQLHHLVVERVALAGELEAGDAVADVPQRGRAVLQQRLAAALHVLQPQHAFRAHESRDTRRPCRDTEAARSRRDRSRALPRVSAAAEPRRPPAPTAARTRPRRACRSARTAPTSSCSRAASPHRPRRCRPRSPARARRRRRACAPITAQA